MVGRVRSCGLFFLLLALPVLAHAQEPGGADARLGDDLAGAASDAAASADRHRDRVMGDETFQGGFTCLAPAGSADTGPIVCESQINPVLPSFYFTLAWHLDRESGDRVIEGISIRHKGKAEPFQVISDIAARAPAGIGNAGFEMVDVDFDGYLDMRLLAETSAGPNTLYRNWLWSQEASRFVDNPALDEIVSPEFDPETQEILSRWRSNATEGGVDVYTWDDGTPVMIHRETDSYDGPSRCTRTFYDRIDGEMHKTGEGSCV